MDVVQETYPLITTRRGLTEASSRVFIHNPLFL